MYRNSKYHENSERDSTVKILTKRKIETKIIMTNFYVISILVYVIRCWTISSDEKKNGSNRFVILPKDAEDTADGTCAQRESFTENLNENTLSFLVSLSSNRNEKRTLKKWTVIGYTESRKDKQ